MEQMTFSEAEHQNKNRKIRREIFLERMDKLIPCKQLEKKVTRYYPKGQNCRPRCGFTACSFSTIAAIQPWRLPSMRSNL